MQQTSIKQGVLYGAVIAAVIGLTGCAHVSGTSLFPSTFSSPQMLLCEQPKSCVDAKIISHASTAHTVALQIRITHEHHHYDIQRVSFDNGQQMLTYMPIQMSMRALGQGQYLSFTTISVPSNLVQQLAGSRLEMKIYTDHGVIKRYLAVDGKYTPLYVELAQKRTIVK